MRNVQKSIAFYCFRTLAIGFSFIAFCSCNQNAMSVMAQEGDDKTNDGLYQCKRVGKAVQSQLPAGWMGRLNSPFRNYKEIEESVMRACKTVNDEIKTVHATELETCRTENVQIKEKLEELQRLVAQFNQPNSQSGSHGGDPNLLGSGPQNWQPYAVGGLVGMAGMALIGSRYYYSRKVSRLKKELKKKEDKIDKLQKEKYIRIQKDAEQRIRNIGSTGSLQGSTEQRGERGVPLVSSHSS